LYCGVCIASVKKAYERPLNPLFAESIEQHEQDDEEKRYEEESQGKACEWRYPVDDGEREVEEYGYAKNDEDDGNGKCRYQSHHLLYDVELQVLFLEFKMLFEGLNELYDRLYVLVAGKHNLNL
jgi:hypothetical protein